MFLVPFLFSFASAAGCDESLKSATLALQQNNPAQALALLEPLQPSCGQSSSFFEILGIANEMSGNGPAAEKALRSAVTLDNKSPRLLTELGATLLRNSEPIDAGKVLNQALLLDPTNVVTLKYAAGAAVQARDWPRAAELFGRMNIEKNSRMLQDEPVLMLWLAQTLIETKQSDRLDGVLSGQRSFMPPGMLFSLGTLFAQHGMYERAVDYLKSIPADVADDAVYFNLGLSYSHLQRFEEARQCYFEAIDKHPDHADAYFHVGLDYIASGQPRMGVPWLYKADSLASARPDIVYALAEQLIALEYFTTAKELLASSLVRIPDDPLLMVADGDLEQVQANSVAAMTSYQKALAQKPGLVPGLVGLARADLSGGKQADAKTLLSNALAHDPQDPIVNREIGLMEAHQGDWNSAVEHLGRAWAQNRSDPEIAIELARAYQQTKRPEEALRILKTVAPAMEDSSSFHFQLAQLYTLLHRAADAQAEREQVAAIQARSQDTLHFENPRTYVH